MSFRLISSLFFCTSFLVVSAQSILTGTVSDEAGSALIGVNIISQEAVIGITNAEGNFQVVVTPNDSIIIFSYVGFETKEVRYNSSVTSNSELQVFMAVTETLLEDVEVVGEEFSGGAVGPVINIAAKAASSVPSAFGDISQVLATLPGVANNNELSSTYSVRGGNFSENLVYVNDIPIYRPFLASSGRQEGLSFVNTDLVKDIKFYGGGWEAKYGDKLSSSLNIEYKTPDIQEGAATIGLLGGSAYMGGKLGARQNYLIGVRHRDSQYLLNTLEVDGEYFPTFTDVQALVTFDLSSRGKEKRNWTTLDLLMSYARNRYLTTPISQQTEFGSVQQNFRLETAFIGREILDYDTYQMGTRLTRIFNDRLKASVISSVVRTIETENYDVEGAYRLCDVDNDPSSSTFEDCVVIRGVGTNYSYGRNELAATLVNLENRYELILSDNQLLEWGVGVNYSEIKDAVNEYAFIDSADFVTITDNSFSELNLNTFQYTGFVQNRSTFSNGKHNLTYGVRINYWDENQELLFSPRAQYRWQVGPSTVFRLAGGLYAQPPFYRELRDRQGQIVNDLKAQKSWHIIAAFEKNIEMWGRGFVFSTETYFKGLSDVIAYDIENIRLRYFADNDTRAFARGIDFRINGEFIPGTQSWFSLGLLQTKEDIARDGRDFIRRPTDQLVNIGIFFEDHLPRDPSMRVYVNLNLGSGYPFGPPERADLRNSFQGDEYYRLDIGLSKRFSTLWTDTLKALTLRAEILNALAADNTLSYTWIEDVNGANFAVPNSLSARFLNIKLTGNF